MKTPPVRFRLSLMAAAILTITVVSFQSCKPRYDASSWTASDEAAPGEMPTFANRLGIKLESDLTIKRVAAVSPGCVMGLREGDTITSLNGKDVRKPEAFEAEAERNLTGDFAPWCIAVVRNGREMRLPRGCDFEDMASNETLRDYFCDPISMRQCGPLPPECSGLER